MIDGSVNVKTEYIFQRPVFRTRGTIAVAVILAGWPVIRWYVARLHDGTDEPLGLLALMAAVAFAPRRGWGEPVTEMRLNFLMYVLGGYILGFHFIPPLARALLWIAAIALVLAPKAFAWAWSTLLVLSLPFVASLQFYLGYPLRCITTQVAAGLLRCGGLDVRAESIVLRWMGERVLIDAPCSGIHMLWTLLLIAAVLANVRRWDGGTSLRIFRFASLAVMAANSVRAVALFCIEMRLWPSPPFAHEAVGLILFSVAGGALLWKAERVGKAVEKQGRILPGDETKHDALLDLVSKFTAQSSSPPEMLGPGKPSQ